MGGIWEVGWVEEELERVRAMEEREGDEGRGGRMMPEGGAK